MWMRSLYASLPTTGAFVLFGNIHDLHPVVIGDDCRPDTTINSIWEVLKRCGFDGVVVFDPLNGFRVAKTRESLAPDVVLGGLSSRIGGELMETLSLDGRGRAEAQCGQRGVSPFAGLSALVEVVARGASPSLALVVDYTSQMRDGSSAEDEALLQAMLASVEISNCHALYNGAPIRFGHEGFPGMLRHPVFWLVDAVDDLPSWMTNGDGVRQIPIAKPDIDLRLRMAALLLQGHVEGDDIPAVARRFADATEGFSMRGMYESVQLALRMRSVAQDIEDAVRTYRQGLSENPWQSTRLREQLIDGREILERRVLGQSAAVDKVLDILKRSALGLTTAHKKNPSSMPRGVLYFAGPTGVGKTEMAKAIAELVFADEQALIRFDMSEFQDDHAKIRLVGAPPSYVGYGSGGELTNAVRERPHSIILFDEMDKAGREVNDLFLQILSDGRLTDGSGRTAMFNESLIIFTSNQGVAAAGSALNVDMSIPEEALGYERTIREAVERHFREELGRPEILGRLGDNIVVFHPMQGQVAYDLADKFIDNILSNVRIRVGSTVVLSDQARKSLVNAAIAPAHLANGGRGIANALEELLVNPLGRVLFDGGSGQTIVVSDVVALEDGAPRLVYGGEL